MKAFAQFMLSIGSMGSLDTSVLTQILLLGSHDEGDGELESEASELEQILKLQIHQQPQQTMQCLEASAGTWAIAAELENDDGNFIYQLVRL